MDSRWRFHANSYIAEIAIFLLALLLRLGYWRYAGTQFGGDWSGYSEACTVWATDPLGILTAHKGILYAGFTLPFCQVLSLPATTVNTWVAIQIILSALACIVVYRTGRLLVDDTAGLVAGFGLAILWDTWLWTRTLYSTAMFTVAMVCCLWAFAHYQRSGSWPAKTALFAAFGFLSVTHPLGPPIVLGWVVYDVRPQFAAASRRIFTHRSIPAMASLSSLALGLYAANRYWLPDRWYRGEVVYNDPTYSIPVQEAPTFVEFLVTNHVYALAIPVARALLFFVPFFPRNSLARIGLNLVTYTPLLLIAGYGAYRVWHERRDLFRYLVTPAVVLLAITAVYTVSWDLRYRAVLGPCVVLLAGYIISENVSDGTRDRFTVVLSRFKNG